MPTFQKRFKEAQDTALNGALGSLQGAATEAIDSLRKNLTCGTPAAEVGAELGLDLQTHLIGPRRAYLDHTGDWARAREVTDAGCVLVRPDHHVCWRADAMADTPSAELRRVFKLLMAR